MKPRPMLLALVALALAGCAGQPTGDAPPFFHTRVLGIPTLLATAWSETQITGTEGVTAYHALRSGMHRVGVMDIGAFDSEGPAPAIIRTARLNEPVSIYGTSVWCGCAMVAHGTVLFNRGWIEHHYSNGQPFKDWGIVLAAHIAPGYSGGSVVADSDGALLGVITEIMEVTEGSDYRGPAAFAYAATDIRAQLDSQHRAAR